MATPARPRFGALRSANFRTLWGGLIASNAGTQMQTAGLYRMALELTGSTVALGLINLLLAILLAIDNPTRQALIPDLVAKPDLVSAASLNAAAFTGAALIGLSPHGPGPQARVPATRKP